jgi:hypothetical protein
VIQQLRQEQQQQQQETARLRDEMEKLRKQQQTDVWKPYRATLCVTDETTLGPNTQQALKLFKAAINQRLAASVSDTLSDNERNKLDQASKKFPTCGRDMPNPPRNPFEVGLYAFNTEAGVNRVLRAALAKAKTTKSDIYSPGENEAFDVNLAVPALRAFYSLPRPAGMKATELDDQVWIQSRKSSGR